MTNVKKRSAAQADLFSGVKRLKEITPRKCSWRHRQEEKLSATIIGGDDHWR